jgi:DNA-binding helix-hairpin-helix protein with protein kinase domain
MERIKIEGRPEALGKQIGKGGEGVIYTLQGNPHAAAKIYKEGLRRQREPKVRAMIESQLASATDLVAFPIKVISDLKGNFAGFIMQLVSGYRPVHELYSPKSRKLHFAHADYRFLVRAALNVAQAVGKVHQTGCVIGDFNHSGVLVSQRATVSLIDADSFQFTRGGRSYPCVVGVPDFTPPELHGVVLGAVTRTRAHDHFGLAVAIFHILAMGRHPYAGHFAGGDLTMSEAIAQNRFAFSLARKDQVRTTPPPASISLRDFPISVAQAFEAAFGLDPNARPDAAQWVTVLQELEASLSHCTANKSHYYPSAAGKCIWCRITAQSGVDMFPHLNWTGTPHPHGPFDVEGIWTTVRAIKLPRPEDLLPKPIGDHGLGSPAIAQAKQATKNGKIIGIAALFGAAIGFALAAAVAPVWLGLGIFGAYKLFGGSVDQGPFRKAYDDADKQARNAELAFLKRIGLVELYGIRDDLEHWINEYRKLDADLARSISHLKVTRETRQRDTFLDRFYLRNATISGIGPAKKATLASYGIETAADISRSAVLAVPGFGEATLRKLLAWRNEHEKKFRYNSAPDASDAQAEGAIRSADAVKRAELQSKIRSALTALQTGPQQIVTRAQSVDQPLMHLLRQRAKAARDLELLGTSVPWGTPITIEPRRTTAASPPPPYSIGQPQQSGVPSCPRCGSRMLRRTARRGNHAGRQFWGCSRYPSCNGIRN